MSIPPVEMATNPDVSEPELQFTISPELADFNEPIPKVLAMHKAQHLTDAEYLAVGIAVYDAAGKVLLVQRSAGDSLPGSWEIPGGGCDPEDPSVLYSAARELREETGLRAKSMIRAVGSGTRFRSSGGKKILKLTFEVGIEDSKPKDGNISTSEEIGTEDISLAPAVKLDPKEHQNWLWASEDEVASGKSGSIELPFTHDDQKDVILQGFALRSSATAES